MRIFCPRGIRQTFGAVILGGIIIVAIWTCLFSILMPLQCGTHFKASWSFDPIVRQKYCSGSFNDGEAWVITDVILDFFIICLPLPSVCVFCPRAPSFSSEAEELILIRYKIWKLKMSTKRKLAITAIFFLVLV